MTIRRGVTFAVLMLGVAFSGKLALSVGLVPDAIWAKRISMMLLGAFFVFTGNATPKMLTPLASLRCDPARVQAVQRIIGWTWVLMGFAYAGVWALLPLEAAAPVSMAIVVFGTLAVFQRVFRSRWQRHRDA